MTVSGDNNQTQTTSLSPPKSFGEEDKALICRKRSRVGKHLTLLVLLTPTLAISSLMSLTISLITPHWLHTEERMENTNRTVLYGPNQSPEFLIKATQSGLFLLCQSIKAGSPNMTCESIDYFSDEEYSMDAKDSTNVIPYLAVNCLNTFLVAFFILSLASVIYIEGARSRVTRSERNIFIFAAGILFIFAGMCMFVGLVQYISLLKTEIGHKLLPSGLLSPPRISYVYGFSFHVLIFAFLAAESTGTMAIFVFIYQRQWMWLVRQDEFCLTHRLITNQIAIFRHVVPVASATSSNTTTEKHKPTNDAGKDFSASFFTTARPTFNSSEQSELTAITKNHDISCETNNTDHNTSIIHSRASSMNRLTIDDDKQDNINGNSSSINNNNNNNKIVKVTKGGRRTRPVREVTQAVRNKQQKLVDDLIHKSVSAGLLNSHPSSFIDLDDADISSRQSVNNQSSSISDNCHVPQLPQRHGDDRDIHPLANTRSLWDFNSNGVLYSKRPPTPHPVHQPEDENHEDGGDPPSWRTEGSEDRTNCNDTTHSFDLIQPCGSQKQQKQRKQCHFECRFTDIYSRIPPRCNHERKRIFTISSSPSSSRSSWSRISSPVYDHHWEHRKSYNHQRRQMVLYKSNKGKSQQHDLTKKAEERQQLPVFSKSRYPTESCLCDRCGEHSTLPLKTYQQQA